MVRITIDGREPFLKVSGSQFANVIAFFKKNHFSYDEDVRAWSAPSWKVISLLSSLRDLDDVEVDEDTLRLIRDSQIPIETRFVRAKLDPRILKVPPLKGKYPNEDFQLEDIKKGIQQNRILLAHEMGLGKTYIASSILNHYRAVNAYDKLLVVCPSEGVYNWKRELLHFLNSCNEQQIKIADRENRKPFTDEADIVIMTYRTFLMLSDDAYYERNPSAKKGSVKRYRKPPIPLEKWGNRRAIVLDESHNIKNRTARQTHTLSLHKHYFDIRILASGTPDPNGIEGYYSQLKFLDEGVIQEDYHTWIQSIANLGNRFSDSAINFYYPKKVEEFVEKIQPWVIRRKSDECLDLPELYIKKVYVPLKKKQKAIYQELIDAVLLKIEKETGDVVSAMINKFPFLSLALDNPAILLDSDYEFPDSLRRELESWKLDHHSRIDVLDDMVNEASGKLVLWSGHPLTIEALSDRYSKRRPIVVHGRVKLENGQTMNEYRDSMIREFRENRDRNLLIGSYKVMSTSINLIEASQTIYFDRSYDLKEWLQSIKRLHRYGQTKTVMVRPILIEGTLDERLDRMLERKGNINANLFSRGRLSAEEWKRVFIGEDV